MQCMRLRECDLSLMEDFVFASIGRVCPKERWHGQTVPQGVSVFLMHKCDRCEYLFTKDEFYDGKVDWRDGDRDEVVRCLKNYAPEEGVVFYLNKEALQAVSRYKMRSGDHAF